MAKRRSGNIGASAEAVLPPQGARGDDEGRSGGVTALRPGHLHYVSIAGTLQLALADLGSIGIKGSLRSPICGPCPRSLRSLRSGPRSKQDPDAPAKAPSVDA